MDEHPTLLLPPDVERPAGDPERAGPPPPVPSRWHVALVAVIALIAGAAAGAVAAQLTAPDPAPAATGTVPLAITDGRALDVPAVVEALGPSVVSIQADLGGPFGRVGTGAGTGIVLTAGGEILTNAHVVDGASAVRVTVTGAARSREATVIGTDPANDLALLRVEGADDLVPAELGSVSDLRVGDDVVAMGNALALRGGPSVTRGIVSALDRTIETAAGSMTGLVQTDASISSGNSGGPLVNAAGQVIGVNTAVATSAMGQAVENIGFAIPIDKAMEVVERLRAGDAGEAPTQGYLGVSIADPTDGSRGAVITGVEPGSAAEDAGLEVEDLVTHVDGRPVDGAAALADAVRGNEPGETIEIDVVRGDGEVTLTARLGRRT